MQEFVDTINNVATTITPAAISLGLIGVILGLAMSVIGYRHGSDVMRTSIIGMIIFFGVRVLGAYFQTHLTPAAPKP